MKHMLTLLTLLTLLALCVTAGAAEPWKTTVARAEPAKKGYDCGCHGQGNCVCGPGCNCVPFLTAKKGTCGCTGQGDCTCALGICTCPACAQRTVATELDEYAFAYAKALREGKHLIVCVGFCRADLKRLPGVVGCCEMNVDRFAAVWPVTTGTLVVGKNEGGRIMWTDSLPGNASVGQVQAAFQPVQAPQQFYAPPMMMGGFGGGFGGGGCSSCR